MITLEMLIKYCEKNWKIFPIFLKDDGKGSRIDNWQEEATNNVETINNWHKKYNGCNWGVVLGRKSGLIVVDHDIYKIHSILEIPNTLTSITGRGGYAYYYKYIEGINNITNDELAVEILSDGKAAVLPPSMNLETKNIYTWENWDTEIAEFPQKLYTELQARNLKSQKFIDNDIKRIIDTNRNIHLASFAGQLRFRGLSDDLILSALKDENNKYCLPPLGEKEVETIAKSYAKYPEPEVAITTNENLTDLGNAKRLIEIHGDKIRYCEHDWYIWNGKVWEKDTTNKIYSLVEDVIRLLYKEASEAIDSEERKKLSKHAYISESAYSAKNLLFWAKSKVAIRVEDFDKDNELLNVRNGIINLRTGGLLPHSSEYLMRKIINFDYNPDAKCPKWLNFLDYILRNDTETIHWIQKALGLSISGRSDKVLPFLWGTGGNGKSVFSETLLKLFNDYGQKTNIDAFSVGDFKEAGDKPNSYLIRLKRARFVIANETREDGKLNIPLIKDLTGVDTITGRDFYSTSEEFSPTHTIWLYGNHKPVIQDTTDSIWDRICEIPFTVKIPTEMKKPLDEVVNEFLAEGEGILNWIVQGYQIWLKEGLIKTETIEIATNEYRTDEDILKQFIKEECELGNEFKISKDDFVRGFTSYCYQNGEKKLSMTKTKITRRLREMEIEEYGRNGKLYKGIQLIKNFADTEKKKGEDLVEELFYPVGMRAMNQ